MTRQNIDFGIDLGTTNSAIAVAGDDGQTSVIRNNDSDEFTPSAVMIAKSGAVTVGRAAKQRIEDDPDNARAEFKLQMGLDDVSVTFGKSGRTLTPPELSAEVLKSLKSNVRTRLGEDLDSAIITIPAAFELHQTEATRQAAALAGIAAPNLLQEPTAAAFAYSRTQDVDRAFWLVYDLGGGTFDAAVMNLRDGDCRLVAHHGDNALGGKRIDWDIVDRVLIPAVHAELGWTGLARGHGADPRWRAVVAKLKGAAEKAKIELSGNESTDIELYDLRSPDGQMGDVEITIKRAQLEEIATPYYQRSIQLCRQALDGAGLTPDKIDKVLLVGGSTIAPAVRRMLADPAAGLGIEVDQSLDPVTVVARGAAVFAANQLRTGAAAPVAAPGQASCTLDFEPVSDDPRPLVGVTLTGPLSDWTGHTLLFDNPNGRPPWQSPRIPVRPDGRMTAELVAQPGTNTYELVLHDAQGTRRPIVPGRLTYRLDDRPISDQAVLPRSLGVGLASGTMLWFARAGDEIERGFEQTRSLFTTSAIGPGSTGAAIRIPVLQGDQDRPDRNRAVGMLEITADQVRRDLPIRTEVKVTIEIDQNQKVVVTALVPLLDLEVDAVIDLTRHAPERQALQAQIDEVQQRITDLDRRTATSVDPEARQMLTAIGTQKRLQEITRLLSTAADDPGDADACQNRLVELQVELDRVEDRMLLPEQMAQIDDLRTGIRRNSPSAEIQRELAALDQEISRAERDNDSSALRSHEDAMRRLLSQAVNEDPEFELRLFMALRELRDESTNPGRTQELLAAGQQALNRNDRSTLKGINSQLLALMPPSRRPTAHRPVGSAGSTVDQ